MSKFLADSKQKALVVGLLVFILFGLLGWQLLLQPGWQLLQSLKVQDRDEIKKQSLLDEIALYEKKLITLRKNSELYERIDSRGLIKEVSDLAKASNVILKNVSPLPNESAGLLGQVSIKLELQSSYHELGKFLSRIESQPKMLKVSHMDIQRVGSSGYPSYGSHVKPEEGLLSIFFVVSAYYAS